MSQPQAEGLGLAERAVAIDPGYAAAREILSRILIQLYVQPYDERRGDPVTLERALEAARRAVALDPRHPTAPATLGYALIWKGEHAEGLDVLRRSILLNPSDAAAVSMYGNSLSRAGQQREALAAWAEAARLDPLVVPINKGLAARSHILLGEFDAAYALTSDCLQRAPATLPCHLFHIMAARGLGHEEEVERAAAAARELAPFFTSRAGATLCGSRMRRKRRRCRPT